MLNFNINQENNSFVNLNSAQNDVRIETEGSISAAAVFSTYPSANLIAPKTARDNFVKIFNMKQKKISQRNIRTIIDAIKMSTIYLLTIITLVQFRMSMNMFV